jgi:zinc protease
MLHSMPFVLALLLSTVPPPQQPNQTPSAPKLALDAYVLPNGLKVALHRDTNVPRVTVCVAYHVGSKNESAGRTGFAHFFEHMMFRGTKNVPNYDIPLQEAGAQTNAFTNEDMTVYFETVPSNFLERALYLEAERLGFLPSALDQMKFDTEREVVKNERRQSYENVPYGLAEETLLANVFPKGHPYSWSVIGSMKDLDSASLADLRRFFAEFYHPANATLCLVGDFDPAQAKALIAKYFGVLERGPEPRPVASKDVTIAPKSIAQVDDVQLPRVYWAWPTVADDHPDAPALELLSNILTGGEASRLHKALVLETRVAKDVDANSDTKEVSGLFTIQSTALEGKTLADIERVLAAELDRIRKKAPEENELARALANHEKSYFVGLTGPLNRAIVLAVGFSQKNDPLHYQKDYERFFRVTTADLQRVASRYLTPESVVLRIEPSHKGQKESPAVIVVAGAVVGESAAAPIPERKPKGGPEWTELPGPSSPAAFQTPRVVRKTLSNGMELWALPWHTLPIMSAHVQIPVGTADDPAGKSGLATLTGTLLDKGTKTRTATELAEAFGLLGAAPGVAAGVDHTNISFSVVARQFEPAMTLVAEMLTSPRFDPKDIERERALQLSDLLQGPDSPQWIAQRAFRALLYGPKHPYGNPSQGYVETVKGLSESDIRDFHKTRFGPKGTILIVVGDFETDKLVAMLEKTLGAWKSTNGEQKPRPAPHAKAEPRVAYLVDKPGAVQSVLSVGRPWVDRNDPRYFAALIGNRILGADFLSRLNQNLREKNGFSYGAGSVFLFRRTGSVWAVSTSVRADATAAALREVISELDALAGKKPFTAEEIATARSAEARSFPESFESPSSLAGILSEMAEFNLPPDYLATYLDQLQAAKSEDVHKAMTEVVTPKERVILVVGDRAKNEAKLKELGFERIQLVTPDGMPVQK